MLRNKKVFASKAKKIQHSFVFLVVYTISLAGFDLRVG